MVWALSGACLVLLWLVASAHWRINQLEQDVVSLGQAQALRMAEDVFRAHDRGQGVTSTSGWMPSQHGGLEWRH